MSVPRDMRVHPADLTDEDLVRIVDWLRRPLPEDDRGCPVAPEPSVVEVRLRLVEALLPSGKDLQADSLDAIVTWCLTGIYKDPAPQPPPQDQPGG